MKNLKINVEPISYTSVELEHEVSHYILIAEVKKQKVLLSVPNLYLYKKTRSSIMTSRRYANVISKFYRFLATQSYFKDLSPGDYHTRVRNLDIRRWQISRQIKRIKNSAVRPSSHTIFEEAKILLNMFGWAMEAGIQTNVKIQLQTWVANFKRDTLLSYVHKKAGVRYDTDSIRVLDREAKQGRAKSLITNKDVLTLISVYPDSVYASLFCFALSTAMRPSELCDFPFLGNAENKHIMPFSSMDKGQTKYEYTLIGKGNKLRTIIIPAYALRDLESTYIKKDYPARKKKYKAKYGKACPPSILFLTSEGEPVTEKMISDATTYAAELAIKKDPTFRKGNNFYQARHWWPTMMMVQHRGALLLTEAADVIDAAFAETLMKQMGHSSIATTYKYYLDLARALVMANEGMINDIITDDFNIHAQIEKYGKTNVEIAAERDETSGVESEAA
ncbi:site-specific integrase [Pseudomonas putida]|uniref:site-specific integrase n=1 Tax=Pseudomonas putida TaxID=303 RepID=UPI0015951705|nr:site-specific integrase [Pseudomonas putida]